MALLWPQGALWWLPLGPAHGDCEKKLKPRLFIRPGNLAVNRLSFRHHSDVVLTFVSGYPIRRGQLLTPGVSKSSSLTTCDYISCQCACKCFSVYILNKTDKQQLFFPSKYLMVISYTYTHTLQFLLESLSSLFQCVCANWCRRANNVLVFNHFLIIISI